MCCFKITIHCEHFTDKRNKGITWKNIWADFQLLSNNSPDTHSNILKITDNCKDLKNQCSLKKTLWIFRLSRHASERLAKFKNIKGESTLKARNNKHTNYTSLHRQNRALHGRKTRHNTHREHNESSTDSNGIEMRGEKNTKCHVLYSGNGWGMYVCFSYLVQTCWRSAKRLPEMTRNKELLKKSWHEWTTGTFIFERNWHDRWQDEGVIIKMFW